MDERARVRFLCDAEFGRRFELVGLCSLPRPRMNGATPLGDCHPDVIPHPRRPGTYLMFWTPFPDDSERRTATENPCVAVSRDKLNWQLAGPVPLVNRLTSRGFNADPDAIYLPEQDRYLLHFQARDPEGNWVTYQARSDEGSDGFHFAAPDVTSPTYRGGTWSRWARSPSVLREAGGGFLLFYDGRLQAATKRYAIGRVASPDGLTWQRAADAAPVVRLGEPEGQGSVWHPTVRHFAGRYYLAAPATLSEAADDLGDLYLWTSDDGIRWGAGRPIVRRADLPSIDGKTPTSAYRCSMIIEDSEIHLWVSFKASESDADPPREVWSNVTYAIALYRSRLSPGGLTGATYGWAAPQGGKIVGTPQRRWKGVHGLAWAVVGSEAVLVGLDRERGQVIRAALGRDGSLQRCALGPPLVRHEGPWCVQPSLAGAELFAAGGRAFTRTTLSSWTTEDGELAMGPRPGPALPSLPSFPDQSTTARWLSGGPDEPEGWNLFAVTDAGLAFHARLDGPEPSRWQRLTVFDGLSLSTGLAVNRERGLACAAGVRGGGLVLARRTPAGWERIVLDGPAPAGPPGHLALVRAADAIGLVLVDERGRLRGRWVEEAFEVGRFSAWQDHGPLPAEARPETLTVLGAAVLLLDGEGRVHRCEWLEGLLSGEREWLWREVSG